MEKFHKEILGLMGKIDIDCREEDDGTMVFDLAGQLDIYNSGDLQKLIEALIARGHTRFVINLDQVTYLDSSTISTFIYSHQKLQTLQGRFMLAGLRNAPLEVFEMAKLHEVFELFPDVPTALKG